MSFSFGTKKLPSNAQKKAPPKSVSGRTVGYRKFSGDALWIPNTTRPDWLDGTLPRDRGFDPLGFAAPYEFLQFELDQLDQNNPQNKAGTVVGNFQSQTSKVTTQS